MSTSCCDPTASSQPVFLNITYSGTPMRNAANNTQCHYDLYIATAAVCPSLRLPANPPPWTLPYDVPYKHGQCGGAGFDMSASAIDLSVLVDSVSECWLHPCGNVTGTSYMLYEVFYEFPTYGPVVLPLSTYPTSEDYPQTVPIWTVLEGGMQYVSTYLQIQDDPGSSIVTPCNSCAWLRLRLPGSPSLWSMLSA